ncbi:aminotransferase class I/II-fold pyridoxal phosphate-dependent enzyme [Nocardia salmonicida]|uniref:aminotransferase class I/II-fold pyridoxal phosphate-dependent enzyme n=1 Tax=Nocardia salmonicida TaxID=53431 RepID=UPI0007A39C4D|nr:pyridoxal phosphate-dependent aminotransferase [Nocardia salmonicida]
MTGDPFFTRLLDALTAPGAGYARSTVSPVESSLDFGVGEAWYPMPGAVRDVLGARLTAMDRIWYSDPRGEAELRAAYLRHLHPDRAADPATVLVTAGGKEAALLAVRFALHQQGGGPVLAPVPGWEPYRFWVEASSATVLGYDPSALAADPGRLRALITESDPRPRVLILNYPHNPTGAELGQAAMDEIIAVATVFGVSVVSDEVYRVFGATPVTAARALAFDPHRHFVVDSVSKSLAVAGLRVGFVHADRQVLDALTAFRGAYASCTSVVNQQLAAALLTDPVASAWLAQVRQAVAVDRAAAAAALTDAGVDVVSHGGLYLWCKTPAALPARRAAGVRPARVSPGAGFGAADHFRVCTARADLDPVAAAAAVVETMRTW